MCPLLLSVAVFLVFLHACQAAGFPSRRGIFATRRHKDKPWERPFDPGNAIPLDELERTATDEEIDEAIDYVSGFQANANIIRPYKPNRRWLWTRWGGTILQRSLPWALLNMVVSAVSCFLIRKYAEVDWPLGAVPDSNHWLISRLKVFDQFWMYMHTLTVFILTNFLAQAYAFWHEFYNIGRGIQGRLNDLGLLLATHAARKKDGRYTPQAAALLDDIGAYMRAFHTLMWASSARRFRVLLTDRGLNRMVQRGILTPAEKDTLDNINLPPTQKYNACLEWIVIRFRGGLRNKTILGGDGMDYVFLEKICALRGTFGSIGDKLNGRMPLAYAHLVQILADTLLICAPFAQVAELGAWSVISVGFFTLFYSGLLDLAKVFLDPLDNEDACESVHMDLSVLIQESNAGSTRWKNGAECLPFAPYDRQ